MPWKLLTDFQSYIFGWLVGYSALLGPSQASSWSRIIFCYAELVRLTSFTIRAVFIARRRSELPGSGGACRRRIHGFDRAADSPLRWLHDYAWFVGFLVASVAYWAVTHDAVGSRGRRAQSLTQRKHRPGTASSSAGGRMKARWRGGVLGMLAIRSLPGSTITGTLPNFKY